MATDQLRMHRDDEVEAGREAQSGSEARELLLADLPVSERRLTAGGVSTAVLEGGEGSPIVLLHGPGEYAAKWLRVIPALVANHRVIAPDLPGHGASEPITGEFGTERILAWLDELIEATCATPPVLVGQIISGAIAARFAIASGQRVRGVVLVDSLGLVDFQPTPEFGSALTRFVSAPSESTHEQLWQVCAHDLDTLRRQLGGRWDAIQTYNIDRASAENLQSTQQRLMELFAFAAIPAEELQDITVPTALIWGRHDLATPLAVAVTAKERFSWPLYVVDDAADDPPLERPEAFLEALDAAQAAFAAGRASDPGTS